MNRRGNAKVVVGGIVTVGGFLWGMLSLVAPPETVLPVSWSGWYAVIVSTLGAGGVWLLLGPLLKERLRRFIKIDETILTLREVFVKHILDEEEVQLKLKAVIERLFVDRYKETGEQNKKIEANTETIRRMSQTLEESLKPALALIIKNQDDLREQLRVAAEVNRLAIQAAEEKMRDLGGRRHIDREEARREREEARRLRDL